MQQHSRELLENRDFGGNQVYSRTEILWRLEFIFAAGGVLGLCGLEGFVGVSKRGHTVVAEIITELIRFEPEICNNPSWKLIGIQERICICNERSSAEIPRDLSVSRKLILLAARFCICNWRTEHNYFLL